MRRQFTRACAAALMTAVLALGATGCGVIELPDGTDRPNITLPTALPTRDSGEESEGEEGSSTEEQAPPQEPEPDPEVVPDEEDPAPPADDLETDEGADIIWWLLAAAVLAIAVVLLIVNRRGRATRQWDESLTAVRHDLRWLDEGLVPEVLAKSTVEEASAAWQAAKPRVLRMDEEVFALQTAERDDERIARATADLAALRELVNAMDAETSTLEPADADTLRGRRAAVERARFEVRARYAGESR